MSPLPSAVIRRAPDDFVVEELPAYLPSGRGEHLYVTFQKRGITTPDALRLLARALDVDPRAAGAAGMKDRHAVTTQTASFPVPIARDAEAAVAGISIPGIEIRSAARHDNKLKPGHLLGNRFTITLRDVEPAEVAAITRALAEIGRVGVPNAFGPQRFGRDGDNPERALAWLSGKERGPRDKREQRLLFSALQSLLYNRVLARREEAGTWATVLPGDVAKKHDTGGLFTVALAGPELADAVARAEAGAISATGPMFGAKMRWPEGEPAAIEREVLAAAAPEPLRFEAWKHLGEGTRRALRLAVAEMTAEVLPPDAGGKAAIVARFVLPKGGYATTVLGRACRLTDASARVGHDGGLTLGEPSSAPHAPGPKGAEHGPDDGGDAEPVDGASGDVQEP
jgi:tRNA pseudouridine13 synthase